MSSRRSRPADRDAAAQVSTSQAACGSLTTIRGSDCSRSQRPAPPRMPPARTGLGDPLLAPAGCRRSAGSAPPQQPLVEPDHPVRLEVALGVARATPAPPAAARAAPGSSGCPPASWCRCASSPSPGPRGSHPCQRHDTDCRDRVPRAPLRLPQDAQDRGHQRGDRPVDRLRPRRRDHAGHRGRRAAARGVRPAGRRSTTSRPPLPRKAFNHMPASMVRQLVGREAWDGYYSFSVERNPWDAVVSLYHWRLPRRPGAAGLRGLRRRAGRGRSWRPRTSAATGSTASWRSTGCCATSRWPTTSPRSGRTSGCRASRGCPAPRAAARPPRHRRTRPTTTTPPAQHVAKLLRPGDRGLRLHVRASGPSVPVD